MIDPTQLDYANTPASAQRPPFDYRPADAGARPVLSIVTPFYNTGAIFHETARSVMQQSLQQFEWIIVNDGSTDAEALAVLDTYRQHDPRLRVIDHDGNRGLSAARNTGFAAATTDLVLQLDSDDMIEPSAAEKWLWFLTAHPQYSFVKGYSVVFGSRTRLLQNTFDAGAQFLMGNCVNPTALVRRAVHQAVGGYDEEIREGLEDWEFWLRCAHGGYWGGGVPEHLEWKRRRPDPTDRWANLRSKERSQAMFRLVRQRYARLWEKDGFPRSAPPGDEPYAAIPEDLPCANRLHKSRPRLLLMARCLTMGGGSKFNLDLVEQLTRRGWEITIAVTDEEEHPWLGQFARCTSDIFILPNIVRLADYPRFLHYLAQSRQVDAILLTGTKIGYQLTPYLRAHLSETPITDYCHFTNNEETTGGVPALSLLYADLLQGTGVTSHQLRKWMVERGASTDKVVVQYINVDTALWRPDAVARQRVRQELGIDAETPIIVFSGRVIPQKQPRVLAQTALRLVRARQRFVLLVAGRGQDLPRLRRFVTLHRLHKQVRLLGAVPQERLRDLLAAADIFFLPSQNEGISLAIYEAMASGLAVVGADVGGQRELVTPECGVLITHGSESADIDTYTDVLMALLAQPERRAAMGAAARARVEERFPLEQMVDGMLDLFAAARTRCGEPAARPAPAAAYASALAAVENARQRRANEPLRLREEAGEGWQGAVRRAGLWLRYPPLRWAQRVRTIKNLIPRSMKGAVKQVLRIP